jgi:tetratricopeptide (TPR) repeat protein
MRRVRPLALRVTLLATWPWACAPVASDPSSSVDAEDAPAQVAGPEATLVEAKALAMALVPGDPALAEAARTARSLGHKPDAWVALGQAWVRRARRTADPGHFLNADACATVALALAPEFRPALDLRLLVMLDGHRFAEARDAAQALVARAPYDALAFGALSDARLELGDLEGAEAAVQRMLDLKPDLPAYARTAYLRWLRGDVGGARDALVRAYDAGKGAKDPEPAAWTLLQAAQTFWHAGDYEGALAGLDLADRSLPDHPGTLAWRGRTLLSLGRPAEAVKPLRASLARAPLPETSWLLADALRATGDGVGADAAEEQTRRLGRQVDPRTLAQFLATRNRGPEEIAAAVRAARAEAAHRGGPYIDDALGFALYRQGTPAALAEARTLLDRAVAVGVPDARLLAHAGLVHAAGGDHAGARALLTRALQLNPAFGADEAAEARRVLESLP